MSARLEALQEQRKQIDAQIQELVKAGKIGMDDLVGQLSARNRKRVVSNDETPNETTLQAIADAGKGEKLKFDAAIEKLKVLGTKATA